MKILLLDMYSLLSSHGGAERVCCNMANALVKKFYEVSIVHFDDSKSGKKSFFYIDNRVELINAGIEGMLKISFLERIRLAFIANKRKRENSREVIRDRKRAEQLIPIINNIKPDIIISYDDVGTRVIKNFVTDSVPVITMIHREPKNQLKNVTLRTLEALKKSECVQVLLPSFVKDINNDNVVCIPNCVPQYVLPNDIEKIRENIIMYAARIDRGKRQHLLIEAFALLAKEFPDWKVEFWGDVLFDKAYYNELKKLVEKYNLQGKIIFRGMAQDMFTQLCRAKIFAFPSASEGFSLALTEAMSAQLPVVAFKSTNFAAEIIKNNETGLLCSDAIDDFAMCLRKLMHSEKLRRNLGTSAKKYVEKYSEEKIWSNWESLINDVVTQNKH